MCIRYKAEDWHGADMNFDDFKKLTPYLKDVETVILEGWGESLLHKNLIEAIQLVKAEGSKVGFVTSGCGLNKDYISELIHEGVDFIGFSLAGATDWTHNSIRVNSDFGMLINSIISFNEIKVSEKLSTPRLHIVYLMLKDNVFEVPALLELAQEINISDVVLTNLIHITDDWQDDQRVFSCSDKKAYKKILKEAESKAQELRIQLRRPSLSPIDVAVCEENPLRNLYISVKGEVSPCVYLYPPIQSPFKRLFCGKEYKIEKVSFGNIFKEQFDKIWDNKQYVTFREHFKLRKKIFKEKYSFQWEIEKLKRLKTSPLPEPPEHCKTCHKILGF